MQQYICQKDIESYFEITDKNRKLFGLLLKQLYLHKKIDLINSKYMFQNLEEKYRILRKIVLFINEIYTPHRINYNDLSSFISHSILNSEIHLFSILCPSYRKDGKAGIKDSIGETTKKAIRNSIECYNILKDIVKGQYYINFDMYYGDCGLEQREGANQEDRDKNIQTNMDLISNELRSFSGDFQCIRLSKIPFLQETIGYQGTSDKSALMQNPRINYKIIQRNHLFYRNILQRSEEQSTKRSEECICNYAIMGKYFCSIYRNPLMLYTANIYEKGAANNFLNTTNKKIMILYVKKNLGSIMNIDEIYKTTSS